MNTLRKLQNNFTLAIVHHNVNGTDTGLDHAILSNEISGKRRLQIYHNNVFISLREALKAVYPVIYRLVGDEFFKAVAEEYIHQHPSTSGNLHDFGNQFSTFIAAFPPAQELVYLGDVAKLEWAYHSVFHAADCPAFDITKLEQVESSHYCQLRFTLNPACRLIKSPYPVLHIWEANQNPEEQTDNISLDAGENRVLVIRRNLDIEFQLLDLADYAYLEATQHNAKFQSACDAAVHVAPECDISQLLQKHILSQAITGFEIDS